MWPGALAPATMLVMAEVHLAHLYDCTEERFWELFFDDAFNQRLFREGLQFPVYEQLSYKETDQVIRRLTHVVPKVVQLPAALKKLVGDQVGYRERGVFDKLTRRFEVDITPDRAPDRLTVHGILRCEPCEVDKCRRLFDATVEARVFGVGGLLERRVIDDLRASYDGSARDANAYLARE